MRTIWELTITDEMIKGLSQSEVSLLLNELSDVTNEVLNNYEIKG